MVTPLFASALYGQDASRPASVETPKTSEGGQPMLRLTTQGEIPLSDFIDYVSGRLRVRLLYDESVRQRKVNLVAPDPIPIASLPEILQSVLINEGLVLTDRDAQGFQRITTNDQIPRVARPSEASEDLAGIAAAVPVTRVFVLDKAKPTQLTDLIKPFLSSEGASAIPLDHSQLLIVTDVASNVRRAEQLIQIVDGQQSQVDIEFVEAKNVTVNDLAEQLRDILDARRKALGDDSESATGVEITLDLRTNSLILIGTKPEIQRTRQILEKLDGALKTEQKTFSLQYFSAQRFDEVIREILAGRPRQPPYRSQIEGSVLIVNSTSEVLELIARTQRELDTREAPESQSPIRYYKIKNVPAQELLETIRGIGGNVTNAAERPRLGTRRRTTNDLAVPGPNASPLAFPGTAGPVQIPLIPPAFRETPDQLDGFANGLPVGLGETPAQRFAQGPVQGTDRRSRGTQGIATGFTRGFPQDFGGDSPGAAEPSAMGLVGAANVTVDIHTNIIIVVAPPEVQRIYASLINTLDQRRPQVLIEAQIVIIDTSDDYTLGVEISGGDRDGIRKLFSFSSYGLSTVDPVSGSLQILPGVGFNGTLVDPSTADVVVRALSNHRRAKVLSTPRILVNDNAEGQLTSVLEVPFTSVNASQTVATTSFAGFAEAGTTINVMPTISEDNYLHLDYTVTLNSFTGTGTDGVPPPRQTNEVRSRVTIPDGYTVIVGGLSSKNESYEIDSIPWLEKIPVIKDIVSLQQDNWSETSLFVFLKPVILREDKFKDLRFLSDVNLADADLNGNFPQNAPLTIE